MRANRALWLLVLLVSLLLAPTRSIRAGESSEVSKLFDRYAPALVSVEFVLQVKVSGAMGGMLGDAQELETETTCVMIDPKGTILCTNTQANGYTSIMQRVMGQMGAQSEIVATPTQIKVWIADEATPRSARLLVRDQDVDLAWLKIDDPGDKRFAHIDFETSALPSVGDVVFAIRRLDKYFDRNPALLEARIAGMTQTPRRLYISTGGFESNLGLPVLTASGQPVGLLVLQLPDTSLSAATGLSLGSMNWSSRMQELSRGVILPGQDVMKATRRALASLTPEGVKKN